VEIVATDLFSGAGGMSLGARHAGIPVCLAIEKDVHATKTYQHNHPDTKVVNTDIRNVAKADLIQTEKTKILFGGLPCQGFSTSNQRTRNINNPNNWLFLEFIRIIKLWQPDWIILENVKGIVETEKGIFLENILKQIKKNKYSTNWWILDSSAYGVPQKRERLFIIGSHKGHKTDQPKAKFSKKVTVWDAISDLPYLKNGASKNLLKYRTRPKSSYAAKMRDSLSKTTNHLVTKNNPDIIERYKYIPQGGNWQNIPVSLMKTYKDRTRCHTGIYHRLQENKPSVVLGNYRKNMLIHPRQDRGLSVREAARLQSFPDSYEFIGSIGFQQQQVGNAVPPLLAEIVFKVVKQEICKKGN